MGHGRRDRRSDSRQTSSRLREHPLTNVGPHDPEGGDGGVEFCLQVDWESPLDVIVTISVLEDIEAFVVA